MQLSSCLEAYCRPVSQDPFRHLFGLTSHCSLHRSTHRSLSSNARSEFSFFIHFFHCRFNIILSIFLSNIWYWHFR